MKKYSFLLCIMALVLCLTACGGSTANLDANAAADKLLNSLEFDDQLAPLEDTVIGILYGIDMSKVADVSVYAGTGATPEEIAVFKAADPSAVPDIEAAVKARVETRKSDFENYIPEEMPKLENPPIVTNGDYVVLVISKDSEKAKAEIEKLF